MAKNRFNEIQDLSDDSEKIIEKTNNEKNFELDGTHYSVGSLNDEFKAYFSKNAEGRAMAESMVDKFIQDLDENTSDIPDVENYSVDRDYTDEELQQLYDEDPGYANDEVIYFYGRTEEVRDRIKISQPKYEEVVSSDAVTDENGEIKTEKSYAEYGDLYKHTGLHRVSWGEDAVPDTIEDEMILPSGTVLERWSEPGIEDNGSYFTDPGADFKDLQMAVSEDKREKHIYEVVKPIKVDISTIKEQPFDEREPGKEYKEVKQYKSSLGLADLLDLGILREVEDKQRR